MSRRRLVAWLAVAGVFVGIAVFSVYAILDDDVDAGSGDRAGATTTTEATDDPLPAVATTTVPGRQSTIASTTPASTPAPTPTTVTTSPAGRGRLVGLGTWGGQGIELVVSAAGGSIQYDCGSGVISEPLVFGADGSFQADGSHSFETGGPVQPGTSSPAPRSARYTGSTDGSEMRLTVTLPDLGRELGPFALRLGRPATLDRCL